MLSFNYLLAQLIIVVVNCYRALLSYNLTQKSQALLLKIELGKTSCAQSKDFHITTVYCKYLPFQILHFLYEQKLDNVKSRYTIRKLFPITKDNADLFIISDKCRKYMFEPI